MYSATRVNTKKISIIHYIRLTGSLLFYSIFLFPKANSQTRVPCNEITGEMGFTVQSVRIMGRWVPDDLQLQVERMVGLGEIFDPPKVSSALELVRDELVKSETAFAIRLLGSTSVLYMDADVCDVSDSVHPKQANVVIRAYYLRIDLYNLGRNILPVPRSAKPTFFREVPTLLLASSPVLGINNDRQYGPSASLQTTTDLLQVPAMKKNNQSKSSRLNADFDIRKSFNNPFHTLGINLDWVHPVYSDTILGWNVGARYENTRQPLGEGKSMRELFRIYGSIQGSGKGTLLNKYTFGGSARFFENTYNLLANTRFENKENGYDVFALVDGSIARGFSRVGIWFDAGIPKNNNTLKPYQRLAARAAYGIVLGSGHNNMDLEVTVGAGHTWGSPQPYAQFFAGNAASNFLFIPINSYQNRSVPDGPVLRSLGEREGRLGTDPGLTKGGRSYWHINLNFSIPVSSWGRPLIPAIVISEEPRVMTLKTALKGQVASAKNFILDDLITNHGFPDNEQTEAIVDRIIDKDIRPTINYLADRANIYSIKPLLLLDIAQMSDPQFKNKTWLAAGIGVQVNVVVARLEMGYMQTLAPSSDSGRGNLFVRFTLQNFY